MSAETYEGVAGGQIQSGSLISRVKAVAGAGIGNVLEWYDFTVYAYLAGILDSKFFVAGDENTALLATFAVFGVGFVARPLGGLLTDDRRLDRPDRHPADLCLDRHRRADPAGAGPVD